MRSMSASCGWTARGAWPHASQLGLGTAAVANTGTADDQVPTNADLGSLAGYNLWTGTEAEYQALTTYDNNTVYLRE